jgi:hypothetical protein
LSGIRFGHFIATCPSPHGTGKDGPTYIKIGKAKPDGVLQVTRKYPVEFWFGHDCRDFKGAYDVQLFLVDQDGVRLPLNYERESYDSYQSRRISPTGQNYCLMYSCGSTYFYFELDIPSTFRLGTASLVVEAVTDQAADKYGFGGVQATFSYPNVFSIRKATVAAPSPSTVYKNCTDLRKVFPSGVAKSVKSRNKGPSLKTKPLVNSKAYSANSRLDLDKDGLVCER